MDHRIPELAQLLLEMEAQLRQLELWEPQAPTEHALSSTQPFCFDTLEFHQWLQWVMLPRLSAMVEQGGPLPNNSDIHPLAEYRLEQLDNDTRPLLRLIQRLDRLLSGN